VFKGNKGGVMWRIGIGCGKGEVRLTLVVFLWINSKEKSMKTKVEGRGTEGSRLWGLGKVPQGVITW